MKNTNGVIPQRLKNLREKKGISQSIIAEFLNIKRPTYTMYEIGKSTPPPNTLQKIADYYGVTTDYLLGADLDKTDLIIQKIQTLTNNKKLIWSTIKEFQLLNNIPKIISEIHMIIDYFESSVYSEEISFITGTEDLYYIFLANGSIESYSLIIAEIPDLEILGLKITSTEKDLKSLYNTIKNKYNSEREKIIESILDDLDGVEKN